MKSIVESLKELPASTVVDAVVQYVAGDGLAIVSGAPDSGASLLIPAALAAAADGTVVVLTPRRAQALVAAEALRLIAGTDVARHVEPHLLNDADFDDMFGSADTRIVFVTYHEAIESGVIFTANTVVLDHADNPSIDVSICKAIIRARNGLQIPETQRLNRVVVVLTAERDTDAEVDYWDWDWPAVFDIPEPQGGLVEITEHETAAHVIALDAIENGHTGVLVFVASNVAMQRCVSALHKALRFNSAARQVTVETLHAFSTAEEHMQAALPPNPGEAKIVVGTSALLSIMDASWASASVSTGTTLRPISSRPGSGLELKEVPLTQIELVQQVKVAGGHKKSAFFLTGGTGYVSMDLFPQAEYKSMSVAQIVMACASYGIDPISIGFQREDYAHSAPNEVRLMQRFGFLDDKCAMTDLGDVVETLPVRAEVAAFIGHAVLLGVLQQALPMAACMENNGVRLRRSDAHHIDETSDWLDSTKAFTLVYRSTISDSVQRNDFMTETNVNPARYRHALAILATLERIFKIQADFTAFVTDTPPENLSLFEELTHRLRQCLLAAGLNSLGVLDSADDNRWPVRMLEKTSERGYSLDDGTAIVRPCYNVPVSVSLHTVTPRDRTHAVFTVAENVTVYAWSDFEAFSKVRPEAVTLDTDGNDERIVVFGEEFFTRPKSTKVVVKPPVTLRQIAELSESATKPERKKTQAAKKALPQDTSSSGVSAEAILRLKERFKGVETQPVS